MREHEWTHDLILILKIWDLHYLKLFQNFWYLVVTWIKEYNGLQAGIFIIIYLELLERKDQLIKDPYCYPTHFQLGAIPRNYMIIT